MNGLTKLFPSLRTTLPPHFAARQIGIKIEAASGGPPTGAPITARVTGTDQVAIDNLSRDLYDWLTGDDPRLNGIIDVEHDQTIFNTVWNVQIDSERSQTFAVQQAQVQQLVADAIDGAFVGDLRRPDDDIPIRMSLTPQQSMITNN